MIEIISITYLIVFFIILFSFITIVLWNYMGSKTPIISQKDVVHMLSVEAAHTNYTSLINAMMDAPDIPKVVKHTKSHCQSCGAPMPKHSMTCEYCGTTECGGSKITDEARIGVMY